MWLKPQFMKSDQMCNCHLSNAWLCLDRSVLIQPCDLRLITTENVDDDAQPSNLSICVNIRLDLLDCKDKLLCCSGGTDLNFVGLRGFTWITIQDSRHFSLAVASEMLNGSCRGLSNFYDRLAVQRSLVEHLSRSRPILVFLTE